MDGLEHQRLRAYGMISSSLVSLALMIWAIICAAGFVLSR
jgi:hypothetical protein